MLGAGLIDVHAHFTTEMYIVAARAAGHVRPDGMPEQFVTRGAGFQNQNSRTTRESASPSASAVYRGCVCRWAAP